MRYQKPVVMDLSAGSRASGQWPLGCYNGEVGNGLWNDCQYGTTGGGPGNTCGAGPQPGGHDPSVCISGNLPPLDFCMIGTGGSDWGDSCEVGSSDV
jgi:hypothetical protein